MEGYYAGLQTGNILSQPRRRMSSFAGLILQQLELLTGMVQAR
jgi:hypothetical protein